MTVSVNGPAPVYARPVVVAYGPMGPTGPAGGPTGNTGNTGPLGTGTVGPVGPTGIQGAQGIQGFTGKSGASGPAGVTGPPGTATSTGATGVTGSSGPTGPGGAASNTGATGNTGPTGMTGYGATGPSGPISAVNFSKVGLGGPINTVNTSGIMAGLAGSITPAASGDVQFMAIGTVGNSTLADLSFIGINYGTGGAPAGGAAVTGWQADIRSIANSNINLNNAVSFATVTGLIVGTTYWYDIQFGPETGGTTTLNAGASISAYELGGGRIGATGVTGNTGPSGPTGFTGNTGTASTVTGPTGPSLGPTGPAGPSGSTSLGVNYQSTAYTAVLADAGGAIVHPASDSLARTFTIPANAAVPYPVGATITFGNRLGAGVVTIAINSDTLVWAPGGSTTSRTLTAPGLCTAFKDTTTTWVISGAGLS